MSKEKSVSNAAGESSWIGEMFHAGVYKRSQGKIARQATFAALAVTFALAAWRIFEYMQANTIWPLSLIAEGTAAYRVLDVLSLAYSAPLVLFAMGVWISYRVVNIPRFADFLIAVEAEMNKVSWPSKDELIRSSIVVIVVIVMMSALLYAYDALWTLIFSDRVLGIIHTTT